MLMGFSCKSAFKKNRCIPSYALHESFLPALKPSSFSPEIHILSQIEKRQDFFAHQKCFNSTSTSGSKFFSCSSHFKSPSPNWLPREKRRSGAISVSVSLYIYAPICITFSSFAYLVRASLKY